MSDIQFRFKLPLGRFELDTDGQFPAEGVTVLFGRSGSGKTSLLRCLAGLEQPRDAYLKVGGEIWHDTSRGLYVPSRQRAIGYVFQEGALFPQRRVINNLLYGYQRTPVAERTADFDQVVQLLGLQSLLQRFPMQLSGGEKQRVAIGRALLNSPRLLLMDEPLAALDRDHKKEILPFLERLHRHTHIPIVYVTHNFDELVRIADHLVLIEEGRILASGPLEEMLARVDLPISRDVDAGAVIDAQVLSHDEEFHLTRLKFAGGELLVTWVDRELGSDIRVRIHAKDVSLALEPAVSSSILNILPARVEEMQVHGRGRLLVKLDLNGVPLLARITRHSQHRLGLEVGSKLYAQVKGVAVLV